MSQISKCPKITVVLSYWEALGEVSELSYKSLLYSTSVSFLNQIYFYLYLVVKILFAHLKGIDELYNVFVKKLI